MTSPLLIIQARMGSTRLPGKALSDLGGRPVLAWVVRAAQQADVGRVVVATSDGPADDRIASLAAELGTAVTRGSEDDVLGRFLLTADEHGGQDVIRLTGDCPLLDPTIIRAAAAAYGEANVDYLSTITPRSLPRGLDVEVVSVGALRLADRKASGPDRSHVTSWLYREPGRVRIAGLTFQPRADDLRVTLDTPEDARAMEEIVRHLGDRPPQWRDLVSFLRAHPEIVAVNSNVPQKGLDQP